ncbi:hypothetical protein HHK36_010035 [Tetracentron sinense]|uniref:Uncharacterized protein n=1 Tax=Tetracentron sinense TaxID=13715 RepID=A0A835DLX1_TETSI|nr:hypothetical protein HHK36_010035 [Tetracentron sinense]
MDLAWVGQYGELVPECASAYHKYGCAPLYKAQGKVDPLYTLPKKEANVQHNSDKDESGKNANNDECSTASVSGVQSPIKTFQVTEDSQRGRQPEPGAREATGDGSEGGELQCPEKSQTPQTNSRETQASNGVQIESNLQESTDSTCRTSTSNEYPMYTLEDAALLMERGEDRMPSKTVISPRLPYASAVPFESDGIETLQSHSESTNQFLQQMV